MGRSIFKVLRKTKRRCNSNVLAFLHILCAWHKMEKKISVKRRGFPAFWRTQRWRHVCNNAWAAVHISKTKTKVTAYKREQREEQQQPHHHCSTQVHSFLSSSLQFVVRRQLRDEHKEFKRRKGEIQLQLSKSVSPAQKLCSLVQSWVVNGSSDCWFLRVLKIRRKLKDGRNAQLLEAISEEEQWTAEVTLLLTHNII